SRSEDAMELDLLASEKNFVMLVAAAAFFAFWALWTALTWKPPIEGRLQALRTRRTKTRREQAAPGKASTKATSISLMRQIADRPNRLGGAAADQTSRKLRQAGFLSRDAAVVYVFIKLALPLTLGFLMILATSVTGILDLPEDYVLPTCVCAV